MIQKLQTAFFHLTMIPIALVVVLGYAFIALLGLTAVAGLIIGVGEWLSQN